MLKFFKIAGIAFASVIIVAVVGLIITQRVSDGPMEMLAGGSFKTGERVVEPVTDWSFVKDGRVEFELVGFGTSRTAGFIIHDGIPYMTCDLGFMWNRLPSGLAKNVLHVIYIFKHWHTDAVQDGRALIRHDGKLYPTNFVKVEDPEINAALRTLIEERGREYFAPTELGPPPPTEPNDIWFFRMDPRA